MMRIAQVNTSDQGGGAERVALALHTAYRARGHQSTLVVGRRTGGAPDVAALPNGDGLWGIHDRLRRRGRPRLARCVQAVAAPKTIGAALRGREDFEFPGTWQLLELADDLDIVQLHNLHGSYFDLRVLPELCSRVPVVWSPHDQWPVTGHCALSLECERWRTNCGSCPHLRVYPALIVDGTAGNRARKARLYERSTLRVAVPSRWLADVIADSVLAPAVRELRVIPNGINLTLFQPGDRTDARSALGVPDGARVVVFTAHADRASPFKDVNTLLRALEEIGAMPGGEVVAALIGGDQAPTHRTGRVTTRSVGSLPPEGVARWLHAADLYLHAARAESQGLAILEALACGVPVVATSVGGVPEQVTQDTGELVPVGAADELARAASCLLANDERRAEMSAAAAADARRRFDQARQTDDYLEWFQQLTGRC